MTKPRHPSPVLTEKRPSFIPVFEHADIDRKMAGRVPGYFPSAFKGSAGSPKPRAKSLLDPDRNIAQRDVCQAVNAS